MALQLGYPAAGTDNIGNSYPSAYWRVSPVLIRNGVAAEITVSVYRDATTAADAKKSSVALKSYGVTGQDFMTYFGNTIFTAGNTDPTKQAYLYLKTLPEYTRAIDV